MRFSIFQDSDIGARSVNQDRMGYCFTKDALLMLVADGMGGHLRGEVAAQIAMQTVATLFQKAARFDLPDPARFLLHALEHAHREMLRYQVIHRLREAPRTTIVACIVQDGRVWWAHAGDSRLYWLRGGRLVRRTSDHSKVEQLVAMGLLRPEQQKNHPERNKVLTCLGSPQAPAIELSGPDALEPGDRLLLCSDGLWAGFDEPVLCERVCQGTVSSVVPMLVADAVRAAGRYADNATALLMSWDDPDRMIDTLSVDAALDAAVTSTIVFGQDAGGPAELMSDADIDRAVREIREAIDRAGKR
jgi:serine/threonine protein phosphatase PrpC